MLMHIWVKMELLKVVKYDNYATDFSETDYLSNCRINLYNLKSEYILLYVWNSETVDSSDMFREICNIAEEKPELLSIIGLNSYNEPLENIKHAYNKTQWKFPCIRAKEIAKKYYISETPTYILIQKTKNNQYLIIPGYIFYTPRIILATLKH